ncbi:V-type ATP synthase subunit I [Enterococcus saccharolyticus]|uniref:V-type ATP synthase subunit I n=1 Tax=Enterococcus saccharolyticus TaxID=41997 RepID=UPI001E5A923C|nr:V-type ATP synthase subunit I [Enterococcus saccharolyticus]MCD5003232.1 V-type ATP synthase subunit I [Enterococcus saccharolyticus]
MAVSKLSKLSILAEKKYQDTILTLLQGMQNIEVEDSLHIEENQEWLATYFPEMNEFDVTDQSSYNYLLTQIRDAISFIRNHGSSKQRIVTLKRDDMDILQLEKEYDEPSLREMLENIQRLQENWEEAAKNRRYWEEAESWATTWQTIDIEPTDQLRYVSYFLANVPEEQWEEVRAYLTEHHVHLEVHQTTKKDVAFSGLYLKNEAEILGKLSEMGVTFEENPYETSPRKLLTQAKEELKTITENQKIQAIDIGFYKKQVGYLQLNEEILLAKLSRETVKETLASSDYLIVIRGWVDNAELTSIQENLTNFLPDDAVYYSIEAPTRHQIKQNVVPTKLTNKKLIQPFESLTGMYALPKYEEIDPTPWMAPFYLVFFGMMVADLGYGILMLLATTIGLKLLKLPTGTRKFVKMFQLLSVSVIFWGTIYGSAFGVTLPFQLLSPTNDFMTIFMISLIFSGIQIFTGLFLAAKENIKKKAYLSAIGDGFAWQGLLAGIFIGAAGALMLDSTALKNTGITIAIISAISIVLVPLIQSKSKVGGFFSGLYALYGITGYIGDFVSYSRLMALGISGGSIAMAFNMLVGTMPPAARFSIGIVLIVVLQGLNIFLSILGAYVHAARLQYVEFFGKFYEGGGRAFRPFKAEEKYMNIKRKEE